MSSADPSVFQRRALPAAIFTALAGLALTACGGGGGGGSNVRPDTPPPAPDPCATNPVNTPGCPGYVPPKPVDPCESSPTTTPGCPGYTPPRKAYSGRVDNLLWATDSDLAHREGHIGQGVKVAVLDGGVSPDLPVFKELTYRFFELGRHPVDGRDILVESENVHDNALGHGSAVLGTLAGGTVGKFPGGVAPGIEAFVVKTCKDNNHCTASPGVMNELLDMGVRIFNISGGAGDLSILDDPVRLESWRRQAISSYSRLVEGGALLIWAAGNDGDYNLSTLGLDPYVVPEFAGNWLVATGVEINNKGKVAGLFRWEKNDPDGSIGGGAAACGPAKDWCVAAPYQVTLGLGERGELVNRSGTSYTTPTVTGVAALISGAFPWMTGAEIQTTLLSTATHLSNDRVNPTMEYDPTAVYVSGAV